MHGNSGGDVESSPESGVGVGRSGRAALVRASADSDRLYTRSEATQPQALRYTWKHTGVEKNEGGSTQKGAS